MANSAHDIFIKRCIELGKRGGKYVKSNPHVGSVIVFNNKIIGEGWHKTYGEAHAEVNAIASVSESDKHLIKDSILYVSLEPCNHTGKTGPCSEVILTNGIKHVVVSCIDPTIGGDSLTYLESKGVKITQGICASEGQHLLCAFNTHKAHNRPYIILKYAQSLDFFIGQKETQIWISNAFTKRLTHKWRSECDGILIGVNTLNTDDPFLSTRLYPGESPRPIIVDPTFRGSKSSHLYSKSAVKSIVVTAQPIESDTLDILIFDFANNSLKELTQALFTDYGICRLMIEGGANTLKQFIDENVWDECRQITNQKRLSSGIKAPFLKGKRGKKLIIDTDTIQYIYNEV
jgi:diaminohydroxyphosphoribosylaminopyrimidine deaminase/5-amino-6-(5-phosphoribosylamino)uracil reductase